MRIMHKAIVAKYYLKNGKKSMAGCMGHVGATSFFPFKNLGMLWCMVGAYFLPNWWGLAHIIEEL